jgi:putative endonuclease
MPARHLTLGRQGEDQAQAFLEQQGYAVLARNWRSQGLELDIVCERDGELVFVEVKTRGPGSLGRPDQGLDSAKRRKLMRAASLFLTENDLWEKPCRFDLVAVSPDKNGLRCEHVENAFEFECDPGAVGGVDPHWQPW